MSIAYKPHYDDYGPTEVMARVFTGNDGRDAILCHGQLAALGQGPIGDRLRCLFERLVTLMQGYGYAHHGAMIWPDGRPMEASEIADLAFWDRTSIEADLRKIQVTGLMTCEQGRPRR